MNAQTDQQLLCDYAERQAEAAFTELARRHVDLVYSAALRLVRDAHLAEDVTQGVFIALAQNALKLADRAVLSGWLHRTAKNLAANTIRSNVRRRIREQEAATMNELLANDSETSWEQISPQLDAALGELNEADRDALFLRYFEKKSAQEMAVILGISDEAAQKRASRAVERLRESFAKRGVTVGAGGLVVLISANAVHSAPVSLVAGISTTAIAATTITAAALKTIAMTTIQKIIIGAVLTLIAGAGIYEAIQSSKLKGENQTLQERQRVLFGQIQQLQQEQEVAKNQLASLCAENSQSKSNPDEAELLRLRAKIAQLKMAEDDPSLKSEKIVAGKVNLLKQRLELTPKWKIPELQFVTEKDWADVAWDAELNTDDGAREALSKLRETAINKFLNEMMKAAMKKYLAANENVLPVDLVQLKPYFDAPVTDEMFGRYKLLQNGKPDDSADLVKLTSYADEDYDSNHAMSVNGAWGSGFNKVQDSVKVAVNAFYVDHLGQMPSDPTQLASYLKNPIDAVTVQKYLNQILANPPPPGTEALTSVLKAYTEANNGQMPNKSADLIPYITTPEQQAAFQNLEKSNPRPK